jgi:prepilin-type N-terminal cleavage/methylation domain-containing protein
MNKKGITLIELLIALVISAILIAGIYKTFISQQRTYAVQDQVVEMQQNVRAAINKMLREIRMTNFGRVVYDEDQSLSYILPVNGFGTILTTNPNNITIVGAFEQIKDAGGNPIRVGAFTPAPGATISLVDQDGNPAFTGEFNNAANSYLSIGGQECFTVVPAGTTSVLTLTGTRTPTEPVGHFVFKVQAVTYDLDAVTFRLRRNENTGGGPQPLADNIEALQFQYFNSSGSQTLIPNSTKTIQVTVTARTKEPDPDFKGGDGYRRRQIVSTIQLRNMGLPPNP